MDGNPTFLDMTRKSVALTIAVLVLQLQGTVNKRVTVIANVTLIDATGAPAKPNMTVVIQGNKISQIGSTGIAISPEAFVIQGSGKFLIPGLWDMHVHTADESFLGLFIANGITSARDMGSDLDHIVSLTRKVENGELIGPRIFFAGPIVDGPQTVLGGLAVTVNNPEESVEVVRELSAAGVTFIKIYNFLPPVEFKAIVSEARNLGLMVVGHSPLQQTTQETIEGGLHSIEHLTGILLGCSSREEEIRMEMMQLLRDSAFSPQMTNRLIFSAPMVKILDSYDEVRENDLMITLMENKAWLVPTLHVLRIIAFGNEAYKKDPRLSQISTLMRNDWLNSGWPRTVDDVQACKEFFLKERDLLLRMHKSGIGILVGTDTPNPFIFPGSSIHDEMTELVEAGLTPLEVIESATRKAAEFIGVESSVGTIEVGKRADMLLLAADPSADISNTRKILAVFRNGRFLGKSTLDSLSTPDLN